MYNTVISMIILLSCDCMPYCSKFSIGDWGVDSCVCEHKECIALGQGVMIICWSETNEFVWEAVI